MPRESSKLRWRGCVCVRERPVSKWAVTMKNRPIPVLNRCSSSEHIICLLLILAADSCNLTWIVPFSELPPQLHSSTLPYELQSRGRGSTAEHLQLPCWFWKLPVTLLRKSVLMMSRSLDGLHVAEDRVVTESQTHLCKISAWERKPHEQPCHLF